MSFRRGQTAIEMLFILAVILVGVLYVVPSFMDANQGVSIADASRSIGSEVCTYLNLGVVNNDSTHNPLNQLVLLWNYNSVECRFTGLSVETTPSVVQITMDFTYPDSDTKPAFIGNVTKYIKLRLSSLQGFNLSEGDVLYYRGKRVDIEVRVK